MGVPLERESAGTTFVPDLTQRHYSYQMVDATRAPIASQAELRAAQTEGRYWSLVLLRTPRGASVQLTHPSKTIANGSALPH